MKSTTTPNSRTARVWCGSGSSLAAVLGAAIVLPILGYTLSMTLMLAVVLFFVSKRPWWLALVVGVGAALASRLVFEVWLGTALPVSSIGFLARAGAVTMGFGALLGGLVNVFTPEHLLFALLGCVLGMLVGVLPGFGPAAAVSLLIPVTFGLDATTAIIMLAAILYGAAYGGTTTAVLLRIPGEASSIATTLDGYEMAKQGRGGPALVIAALASFVGGLIGVIGFVVVAPFSRFALEFGAPELFLVALLGMALITSFAGTNPPRRCSAPAWVWRSPPSGVDSGVGIATLHLRDARAVRRHRPGRGRDGRLRTQRDLGRRRRRAPRGAQAAGRDQAAAHPRPTCGGRPSRSCADR